MIAMWLAALEALRPALNAWNHGIQRSMDDYAAHPFAACRGIKRVDDEAIPCDLLANAGARLCRKHELEKIAVAKRMRNARAALMSPDDQRRYLARKESKP